MGNKEFKIGEERLIELGFTPVWLPENNDGTRMLSRFEYEKGSISVTRHDDDFIVMIYSAIRECEGVKDEKDLIEHIQAC